MNHRVDAPKTGQLIIAVLTDYHIFESEILSNFFLCIIRKVMQNVKEKQKTEKKRDCGMCSDVLCIATQTFLRAKTTENKKKLQLQKIKLSMIFHFPKKRNKMCISCNTIAQFSIVLLSNCA
jgi:hypothetical protein